MDEAHAAYRARVERVQEVLRARRGEEAPLALRKTTSNLFRDRVRGGPGARRHQLDLSAFDHVLAVDTAAGHVDVEGLATYESIVDATLAHGVMPAVVPQLKTITAGGAVAGVGIEASSFREGLVHDTLLEADVLLPDGELVTCRADNERRDLFLALPNSYGTLGYVLRLRLRTRPVRPFVRVEHQRFAQAGAFLDALAAACGEPGVDFLDAVVFSAAEVVLNRARFDDDAGPEGRPSDYTGERIYHRSLLERPVDWLSTRGWIWRWDTDWFWCSSRFGLERRWLRRLLGPRFLNSRTYTRLMRLDARLGLTPRLDRWRGFRHVESVIQDVDIPFARAGEFLEFLLHEIGVLPIWLCPIRGGDPALPFTLYPLVAGTRYLNFGFWDTLRERGARPAGHYNRLIEQRVLALGGIKSLYSDVYLSREDFACAYALEAYERLKARYDPGRRLLGLYEKCVQRG